MRHSALQVHGAGTHGGWPLAHSSFFTFVGKPADSDLSCRYLLYLACSSSRWVCALAVSCEHLRSMPQTFCAVNNRDLNSRILGNVTFPLRIYVLCNYKHDVGIVQQ